MIERFLIVYFLVSCKITPRVITIYYFSFTGFTNINKLVNCQLSAVISIEQLISWEHYHPIIIKVTRNLNLVLIKDLFKISRININPFAIKYSIDIT